ncbi:MAG: hypothetical protein ACJ71E_07665, partial [Nitrososphaeraceae archaeon]
LATSRLISKLTIHRTNTYSSTTAIADKLKKKEEEEHYSCWCFLRIDGTGFDAKIVHKGRGKFKILNDEYAGKYSNKIVDASDVVRHG